MLIQIFSTNKIIRFIFAAICVTGCLFQIYKMSKIYFLYETVTEVRYGTEDNISLTAITVCASKLFFVKEEYLSKFAHSLCSHPL
jgi:hypothetical protein